MQTKSRAASGHLDPYTPQSFQSFTSVSSTGSRQAKLTDLSWENYAIIEKENRPPRDEVTTVGRKGMKRGYRVALVGLLLLSPGLAGALGQGQGSVAKPIIEDVVLEDKNGNPTIHLEDTANEEITIRATIVNQGNAEAEDLSIVMQYRSEKELEFRARNLCRSNCRINRLGPPSGDSGNVSVQATGFLSPAGLKEGLRYIFRVQLKAGGTVVDTEEAFLGIGFPSPEYHPTALKFSPPSPVPREALVSVRVEIENTGKPSNPSLTVIFSHCPLPAGSGRDTCTVGFSNQGFHRYDEATGSLFPIDDGRLSLSSSETKDLREGRPIEAVAILDTSDLEPGRYAVRVEVRPPQGHQELDTSNNSMLTQLTIGTVDLDGDKREDFICAPESDGQVITLARSEGLETTELSAFYAGVRTMDRFGRVEKVSLHAIRTIAGAIQIEEDGQSCEEVRNSPFQLPADITSLDLDARAKLLYLGLANGQLVVVDMNQPEPLQPRLVDVSRSSLPLTSLARRKVTTNRSEIFASSEGGRVYRIQVQRDATGSLDRPAVQTCATIGSPIRRVMNFDGTIYFGAVNGAIFQMDAKTCGDGSHTRLFTASGSVSALAAVRSGQGLLKLYAGTDDGKLHVMLIATIGAVELSRSPFDLTMGSGGVTALTVNRATETIYAGTGSGEICRLDNRILDLECLFTLSSRNPINVLEVDDGQSKNVEKGTGLPNSGFVFAGSDDNNLVVLTDDLRVHKRTPTEGGIQAQIVLVGAEGPFGFNAIKAFFGSGSGLYQSDIPLGQ